MSAAPIPYPAANVLPFVWAVRAAGTVGAAGARLPVAPEPSGIHESQIDLYRKYTEALLRRYIRMSMEAGKVPSLIREEMFRGNVSSYKVGHFDDVVIFLHDVDRCLERLGGVHQRLVSRLALQQYTVAETAELLSMSPKTVIRKYAQALDRLTRIFLDAKMLQPLFTCQESEA